MRACFHFSYLRGSSNMATSKAKTIDDIDDFKEMLEVMTALEISSRGLKTLDEMKSRQLDCWSGKRFVYRKKVSIIF